MLVRISAKDASGKELSIAADKVISGVTAIDKDGNLQLLTFMPDKTWHREVVILPKGECCFDIEIPDNRVKQ